MKKLFLGLILLSSMYAKDWYIVDMNVKPITCILEPLANPNQVEEMGIAILKLHEGIFKIILGDMQIYLVDSKKNCKKLILLESKTSIFKTKY